MRFGNFSWLSVLGLITLLGPMAGGAGLIAMTTAYPELISPQTSVWLMLGCAAIGGVLAGTALLPSFLVAGVMGYSSAGALWGFALALFALMLATSIGMRLSRHLAPGSLEQMLMNRPKWLQAFQDIQNKNENSVMTAIFLARLSPQAPFALTNLMLGQLQLPLAKLAAVSWLGLIPRTIFATSAGAGVQRLSSVMDSAAQISLAEWSLGALALVAACICISTRIWMRRAQSLARHPSIMS